ncbi:putative phosphatidate cytidylyltransferase [Rosellinia necatrix]|uniref:dolichol kinase n=1 Tax=Rosellinia necatrix TaxID=77044 RepID=A0A1W2TL98_ROSNE|nr:putative phosphatidate cytidylyltransferase [Rosellinia necatrix]
MSDHLDPSSTAFEDALTPPDLDDNLRLLSRSPHPYHHRTSELLNPSSSYVVGRTPPPPTDSGTEADDEHFLKGLPAPGRLHKGVRGRHDISSGASTPFLAPYTPPDEEIRRVASLGAKRNTSWDQTSSAGTDRWRQKKVREAIRRCTELLIICALGLFVYSNVEVRPILQMSGSELRYGLGVVTALLVAYPLRLLLWAYWHRKPSRKLPIMVPSSFDPAPLLYPPTITLLVSSLVAVDNAAILLPNVILALCSLPRALIPTLSPANEDVDSLHWLLTSIPLILPHVLDGTATGTTNDGRTGALPTALASETAILLYPLHCSLLHVLHALTTTSLLTAELQLLSVSLINVFLLSSSPQITILKAMLWVGGLDILVSCGTPIQWGIALARVPKWRFRRPSNPTKRSSTFLATLMSWRRMKHELFHIPSDTSSCSSCEAIDDPDTTDDPDVRSSGIFARVRTIDADNVPSAQDGEASSFLSIDSIREKQSEAAQVRRHTLPATGKQRKPATHTPSGRKKRSASLSIKAFVSLTYEQAVYRKWIYAFYVYACIIGTIFIPLSTIGVKDVVAHEALRNDEPVGWALGYLFGDIQWFRWQVVSHNLGWWICLPPRLSQTMNKVVEHGWVDHARTLFGEANTRLLLSAYCTIIIVIGLTVVFRLSPICEVDTLRKVFHFMMVAMFLPATYIDPCFVALALSIVLAAFLLLDLLRASQLPPLSKPLATFLTPYVDGRDLRGPVVISHIFLLVGCAMPLWLSLGSLPRSGYGHLQGWSVPTREVAMVSGVLCVGLGDAAASLIGRRYGHRKWLWGGGKSLEGSAAFATAVFLGLMVAHVWLRVGGWAPTNRYADTWQTTIQKTGACAGMASLTEAVLTGGNDNVIVPIVLWACVKSLGV